MMTRIPHIHLAADHAGFTLKQSVKDWLIAEGYEVIDYGAEEYDETDDFPDFIAKAAEALVSQPEDRALLFGGSGQGEAMMANRFKGVRATVYYGGQSDIIGLSRAHNDANALSIGARFVPEAEAKQVIWDWLQTPSPTDEKYHRRNQKLDTLS